MFNIDDELVLSSYTLRRIVYEPVVAEGFSARVRY